MREGPHGYKFHGGGDTPVFMRAYKAEYCRQNKPVGFEARCAIVFCILALAALVIYFAW